MTSLKDASSVAGLLITTECLIAEEPKDESSAPAGSGAGGMGMGGMGGMY
jgi:chaperonin GroEL